MLGAGYRGVYDPTAYGEGLMPLDFDGLKKQRFRWALGGIQILKFHWRELLPLAPPPHAPDRRAADPLPARQRAVVRRGAHRRVHHPPAGHRAGNLPASAPAGAAADGRGAGDPARLRRHRGAARDVGDAARLQEHLRGLVQRAAGVVRALLGGHPRLPARPGAEARRLPAHTKEQGGRVAALRAARVAHRDPADDRRHPRRCGDALPLAGPGDGDPRPAAVLRGVRVLQRPVGEHGGRGHHPHARAAGVRALAAEHRRPAGVEASRGGRPGRADRAGRQPPRSPPWWSRRRATGRRSRGRSRTSRASATSRPTSVSGRRPTPRRRCRRRRRRRRRPPTPDSLEPHADARRRHPRLAPPPRRGRRPRRGRAPTPAPTPSPT